MGVFKWNLRSIKVPHDCYLLGQLSYENGKCALVGRFTTNKLPMPVIIKSDEPFNQSSSYILILYRECSPPTHIVHTQGEWLIPPCPLIYLWVKQIDSITWVWILDLSFTIWVILSKLLNLCLPFCNFLVFIGVQLIYNVVLVLGVQ